MREEKVLCGACIAQMKEFYGVVETKKREKVYCDRCGKRRYGCLCAIDRQGRWKK